MTMPVDRKTLNEQWKAKIKASQIINRVNDHALGQNEMTSTQLKAAEILLRKVMPDMKSIEGVIDTSLTITVNKP